ncbi:MAG: tetratricopeptide repeat protein [Planctomycetota bacterium]|jgi:tetratricopeptide (TPR) repeat protein
MNRQQISLLLAITLCSSVGYASNDSVVHSNPKAQIFSGLGPHCRTITTDSAEAQAYFDQGLTWMYAFNHDEAIRSFKRAVELDEDCAMAWWGASLAAGPQYNHPVMTEERTATAWQAMQNALARLDNTTPLERALIEALKHRNVRVEPEDRTQQNAAYARAMARIWKANPDDSDIGALYAESMMIRRPWKLYSVIDQKPHKDTPHILSTLERVLEMDPIEPSKTPKRGLAAADRLSNLVPGSGHLLHMPSHIYLKTGHWEKAFKQNVAAMHADTIYRRLSPVQRAQHLYMTHNAHVCVYAAMMGGREREAMIAARNMWENVDEDILSKSPRIERWMSSIYDVHKRFGRWDILLGEPAPPSFMLVTTATWRAARAVAYAAKKDFANAEREYEAFKRARARIPEDYLWASDTVDRVLEVSDYFIAGEIALQKGEWPKAVQHLENAIAIEDGLAFREPPQWLQPTRHTLGAVYLKSGQFDKAERVYRADLAKWPKNGWSLYGLSRALQLQGKTDQAQKVNSQYREVWKDADAMTDTSCKCLPNT